MTDDLVRVHVREMSVELWAQSQEHSDELLREFMLIAADTRSGQEQHPLPQQLLTLIDVLTKRYSGFGEANEKRLVEAAATGVPTIDLDYEFPPDVAEGAAQLGKMLDQADEFCRAGEHLLTLATPPEQVRFRRWFLDEIVRQVGGEKPTPWPAYQGS